jgi:transposase
MPKRTRMVIGGVDTHGRIHHAAVLDEQGRLLGDREFPADCGGYRQLLSWLGRHGQVGVVVVEGTGSYGAGLARYLSDQPGCWSRTGGSSTTPSGPTAPWAT